MRANPFIYDHPIDHARFVGRSNEIRLLRGALLDLKEGNGKHFSVTGERGIGKTSLLTYLHYMCRGLVDLDEEGSRFNGLVLHTRLSRNSTDIGIAEKLGARLEKELMSTDAKTRLSSLWDVISRINAFSVSLGKSPNSSKERESLLEDFSSQLTAAARRLCRGGPLGKLLNKKYDGVVVILDECDRAVEETDLGSFFKNFLEDAAVSGRGPAHILQSNIMVCIAGLPVMRTALCASHESAARIFNELELGRLSNSDTEKLIDAALEHSRRSGVSKFINFEARRMISTLAEGHPYHAQRLGYSSFALSVREHIDSEDVARGAFGRDGAIRAIGNARYRHAFLNKFSDEQQEVVLCVAKSWAVWTDRESLLEEFSQVQPDVIEAAFASLVNSGFLTKKRGLSASYRFVEKTFGLWLALYMDFREEPDCHGEIRVCGPSRRRLSGYYLVAFCGYTTWVVMEMFERAKRAYARRDDQEAIEALVVGLEACDAIVSYLPHDIDFSTPEVSGLKRRVSTYRGRLTALMTEIRGPASLGI